MKPNLFLCKWAVYYILFPLFAERNFYAAIFGQRKGCFKVDKTARKVTRAAGDYRHYKLNTYSCRETCSDQDTALAVLQEGDLCFCADLNSRFLNNSFSVGEVQNPTIELTLFDIQRLFSEEIFIRFLYFFVKKDFPCQKHSTVSASQNCVYLGTATIRTNDISYNSQKPDISYTDNWYKNETGHFVQKTFRTKLN